LQQTKERLFVLFHGKKGNLHLQIFWFRHKKFRHLALLATLLGPKHGLQVRFPSALKALKKAKSFAYFIPRISYISLKRNLSR